MIFRNYWIPGIAAAGLIFAVFTVFSSGKPARTTPHAVEAPQSPYPLSVAGVGLVESNTENISIGTQIAGIVSRIYVQIGSEVKAGDPLFTIDERAIRADIDTRRAAVELAEVQHAEAEYDLAVVKPLANKGIAAADDLMKKRFAMRKADAQLTQAQTELKSSETELERLTVRAPVEGQVLQLKVHLGEYAPVAVPAAGQPPLILLGGVSPLHVRVDIDENDAWRVRREAPAVGYLRGNSRIKVPLKFVRFEPYVLPKKSLTGDSTERVDTRVLQVIFSFDRGGLPIFVGQQMDAFIDASGASSSNAAEAKEASPRANPARNINKHPGQFPRPFSSLYIPS